MHLLFKLRRLPSFGPPIEHLNADPRTRFNTTLVPDPELQQASYEACRRGEVPQHPPVGMQIPTVMDPSLAPEGFHIATTYGFFFPCEAPRDDRGRLRDEMAERILRSLFAARRATPVPASRSSRGTAPPKRSPRRSVPSPARRREALHRSVPPSRIAACGSVPRTRRCRPQVEGAQKASSLGATMDAVDARNDLRERRAQRAPRRLGGDARVSCGEPRTERASGRRVDAVTHATPPARRLLQRRGIDREATVRPTRSPRSRSRSPRAPTSLLPGPRPVRRRLLTSCSAGRIVVADSCRHKAER